MQNSYSHLLDRFESLGLSRNEGLVYIALLTYQSPTTGYQLAKDHDILRPIAYEMLNRLVKLGGVRMVKEGSKDFWSPIAPETFLSILEKRFNDAKKELSTQLHALLDARHAELEAESEFFWNITGPDVIIAEVQAMALKAQKHILFYFNDATCAKLLADVFSKRAAAGVKIQGFSYRRLPFDFDWAEIYSYNLPEDLREAPEGRIIVVADNRFSLMGDLHRGYASQSSSPSQVETARDYIRMKISLYRLAQIIEPSKLALYLFEDDRQFFERLRAVDKRL